MPSYEQVHVTCGGFGLLATRVALLCRIQKHLPSDKVLPILEDLRKEVSLDEALGVNI